MMNTKRTLLSLALLMTVCAGWSPIHMPGEDTSVPAELTQEQIAQQQMNYQGTLPVLGEVPEVTEPTPTEDVRSDPAASAVIADSLQTDPQAAEIVRQAGEKKPEPSPTRNFLLGFGFLSLGVLSVWGIRFWVSRQVPPMPTKSNKVKW